MRWAAVGSELAARPWGAVSHEEAAAESIFARIERLCSLISGTRHVEIHVASDPELFQEGSDAWSRHVESDPDNLTILLHTAEFHKFADRKAAITLVEHAQALDESNPFWSTELGTLHWLDGGLHPGGWDPEAAARALVHFERADELTDELGRNCIASMLSITASNAGQFEKAREYAASSLEEFLRSSDEGIRVHLGNLTPGPTRASRGRRRGGQGSPAGGWRHPGFGWTEGVPAPNDSGEGSTRAR